MLKAKEKITMSEQIEFYCMACRAHREGEKVEKVVMKNGKNAAKGVCKECKKGVYKVLPSTKPAKKK